MVRGFGFSGLSSWCWFGWHCLVVVWVNLGFDVAADGLPDLGVFGCFPGIFAFVGWRDTVFDAF